MRGFGGDQSNLGMGTRGVGAPRVHRGSGPRPWKATTGSLGAELFSLDPVSFVGSDNEDIDRSTD